MQIAPSPLNEAERLCFLQSLDILDTAPEEGFDRITRLASSLLDVPMALVSLVDVNRQWFKSRHGLDAEQTSRDVAFCAHALHAEDALVIPDALADARFADNPLVVGAPFIRFYAGIPLRFANDLTLGTLCVLDTRPRTLGGEALERLKDLARLVEQQMLQRSQAQGGSKVQAAQRNALASSESRFRQVFRQSPTSKALVGIDGRILEPNREFSQLLGVAPEALVLLHLPELLVAEDRDKLQQPWQAQLDGQQPASVLEVRMARQLKGAVWVELSLSALRGEDGHAEQVVVFARDISERRRRQHLLQRYQATLEQQVEQRTEALKRSQQTLQAIADNLPVLIAQIGNNLEYRFNNAVYREIFGLDPTALKGRKVEDVLAPEVYQQLLPCFNQALAGERVEADNVRYRLDDPRIWHASYVPDIRNGVVEGFFVMSLDVTERKRREQTLLDQATLDPLTGLPNRSALFQALDYLLQQRAPFALYFIDLDGFKQVNDSHGHETGDLLLQAAAERMLAAMRADDLVARLAGDEFVVIARAVASAPAAREIGRKLCDALAATFTLEGQQVQIGASIGVYLNLPEQRLLNAEDALAEADQAMYAAKRGGRNRVCMAGG
ncbi:diguanylate cyclase [Pseudomonas fakonensis]|uniref:Diguanylate cyclase n=1 Tax=Pseudomonas fakonensis TaxID=2842355 RepID=A0ABX8NBB1_9PSED|nr:diguanylate cyclase [Pseudomonas fakonensis]QXH53659.1 diguanylate cyclase [Pseudomonas fakonensis]